MFSTNTTKCLSSTCVSSGVISPFAPLNVLEKSTLCELKIRIEYKMKDPLNACRMFGIHILKAVSFATIEANWPWFSS